MNCSTIFSQLGARAYGLKMPYSVRILGAQNLPASRNAKYPGFVCRGPGRSDAGGSSRVFARDDFRSQPCVFVDLFRNKQPDAPETVPIKL